MPETQEPTYRTLKNALRQLARRPELLARLSSSETAPEAMKDLRIPSDETRLDIINLFNDVEQSVNQRPVAAGSPVPPHTPEAATQAQEVSKSEISSTKAFFEAAFDQLHRAYRTSIFMSRTMFLLGVGFLLLAAYQAIFNPESVATTSVVGGIGVVQIVALFYRNPLADIARTVSNTQQAKIALTSYLIGVSLIRDSIGLFGTPGEQHIAQLIQITDRALAQLQTYTENHRTSKPPPKSGNGSPESSSP